MAHGKGPVECSCKGDNEPAGSIRYLEIVD
jgi:hypothetical protein